MISGALRGLVYMRDHLPKVQLWCKCKWNYFVWFVDPESYHVIVSAQCSIGAPFHQCLNSEATN
jgi:hypothetical protein